MPTPACGALAPRLQVSAQGGAVSSPIRRIHRSGERRPAPCRERYLLPAVQASLESRFATEESIQRFQSLLLATGNALIGAAAIVTSLVLFAMHVNVERMPHGLFRRLSGDRKLLGAFAL